VRKALRLLAGVIAIAALPLVAPQRAVTAASESSCGLDGVERVVAVGDVHGAADRMLGILRTANVIDDKDHWTAGRTHLVQLGDVLDRGPDSRRALDILKRLETEADAAGGRVHVLLGNHEIARMLDDLRLTVPGEYQAFVTPESEALRKRVIDAAKVDDKTKEQLIKETPLGEIEMRIAFGPNGDYGKWLRTLDSVVKINGVLFVHGGISPAVAAMSCDDINARIRRELTVDFDKTMTAPLMSLAAREDSPAWYRGLALEPDSFAPQVDDILAKQSARMMVVAHTVTPNARVRVRFDGKVIEIDTGMQPAYVPAGHASALEFRDGTITAIYDDRKDVVGSPKP
jgi:hypothetical protein